MSHTSYKTLWETGQERLEAPAVARNKDPITSELQRKMPQSGRALEIASGTGEHVCHFAKTFPSWRWHPSDPDEELRKSITAWRDHLALENVQEPIALDLCEQNWWQNLEGQFDFIFNANMIHITPWNVSENLFAGAGKLLDAGSQLCLYGPFIEAGVETAESNADFDTSLKSRNPEWGIRKREEIENLARKSDLILVERTEMPSNNLMLWFRKN